MWASLLEMSKHMGTELQYRLPPGSGVDRMKAFGMFKDRIHMEHFDDPLPEDIQRALGMTE